MVRCLGARLSVSVLLLALFVSGCGSKLGSAAGDGDITEVRKLLSPGQTNVNQEDLDDALEAAVYHSHADVVKLLLEKGADPNGDSAQGWSLLHDAAWGGYEGREHLESEERAGVTGTIVPWNSEYARIAVLLIESGAKPNTATRETLKWGYDSGCFETPAGFTPLHVASYVGYAEMIKLLVARGAEINAKDADGATPLDCAERMGRTDAAKALTELDSRRNP